MFTAHDWDLQTTKQAVWKIVPRRHDSNATIRADHSIECVLSFPTVLTECGRRVTNTARKYHNIVFSFTLTAFTAFREVAVIPALRKIELTKRKVVCSFKLSPFFLEWLDQCGIVHLDGMRHTSLGEVGVCVYDCLPDVSPVLLLRGFLRRSEGFSRRSEGFSRRSEGVKE